jgi:glycerol-3-phosphate dehydrogenase (NAD(P)+)
MQPRRILILGYGAMGRMFETLLSRHDLRIWTLDPDSGEESIALEEVCRDREIVLFALPAHPHRELAQRLAAHLEPGAACLSVAKGLDAKGQPPARIFEETFGQQVGWGLICGPMIARDLSEGRKGFAVLVAADPETRHAAALFADTALHLDTDDDVHGAGWAVILKNVFVPLIGGADALELGDNLRGFLLAEAISELSKIVEAMGGRASTARGPAALGDLLTTATSATSHHRGIGADLALGRAGGFGDEGEFVRSEGVHTIERVREFELLPRDRFPLFDLAGDFLMREIELGEGLERYLACRYGRGE